MPFTKSWIWLCRSNVSPTTRTPFHFHVGILCMVSVCDSWCSLCGCNTMWQQPLTIPASVSVFSSSLNPGAASSGHMGAFVVAASGAFEMAMPRSVPDTPVSFEEVDASTLGPKSRTWCSGGTSGQCS